MGIAGNRQIKSSFLRRSLSFDTLLSTISIAILITAWVIVTQAQWVRPLFLPPPGMLWEAFVEIIPRLPADMFASLIVRIIPGFFLGSLVGIILGIFMGTNKVIRAITDPIVEILRPLPPLALIPLLILWLGIGNMTQILLIAFGSFIILVVTTVEAVRNIPPIYIQAAYTLGATPRQVFRRVMIPAIIPDIFGGIRVAAAASFGYDVAAELMGAPSGLGYLLIIARRFLNTDTIIVVMVIITLLSFLADQSIRRLNNYLTRWKPRL